MKLETYRFRIIGLNTMLTHNPAGITNGATAKTKRQSIPSPEEEAERGLIKNDKGQCCLNAMGFRMGILYVGGNKKVNRKSLRSILSAAVFIDGDEKMVIKDQKTKKPFTSYSHMDSRSVVIKGCGRILRTRPAFDNWEAELVLTIDTDLISVEQVLEQLEEAGVLSGIGDFRPQTKGIFGRYKVELIK